MRNLKLLLALFTFTTLVGTVNAQNILKSSSLQYNSTGFTKVIGENAFGVYLLHHGNQGLSGDFYLERFVHDFSDSKLNKIPAKKEVLSKIAVHKELIHYLTTEGKRIKGIKTFTYKQIDPKHYNQISSKSMQITDFDFNAENLRISTSGDKKSFALAIPCVKNKLSRIRLYTIGINQGFEEIGVINPKEKSNSIKVLELLHTGDNIFVLAQIRTKVGRPSKIVLYNYNMKTNEVGSLTLNNQSTHLSSPKLILDEANQLVQSVALFGDKSNQNKGYMMITYSLKDQMYIQKSFEKFDEDFIQHIYGKDYEENYITNFFIRGIKPRSDGGILFVAEKYLRIDRTETEFTNGQAIPVTRSIYNYDEVIILSVDASGEVDWEYNINKKQSTMYDGGYYSSIQVVFTEYHLHILYNDKMNTSGNAIQHTIDMDGNASEKFVLKSDYYYQYLIPLQGKQIGYNRAAIPAKVNKSVKLIKFTY